MPALFVFSVRVKLVCGLVTVTAAPTRTPPLESVTRPVIWPKFWLNKGIATRNPAARTESVLPVSVCISSQPPNGNNQYTFKSPVSIPPLPVHHPSPIDIDRLTGDLIRSRRG